MNCPQCNAILPDSSTVCVRCGASIRPGFFSYLPAGAPPWPTTMPPPSYFATGASTVESAQVAIQGRDKSGPKEKKRRSSARVLWLTALLIFSLLLGIGTAFGILMANGQFPQRASAAKGSIRLPSASSTATTQPAATPVGTATGSQLPTPSSFQTISNVSKTSLGVSVKYPSDWIEDPANQPASDGSVTADFHPQQQLGIVLFIGRFPASGSNAAQSATQLNQANIEGLKSDSNLHNVQTIQPTNPQRTVGGVQWDEEDASFLNPDNVPFHVVSISVKHKQSYYTILFWSPQAYFDEAVQKYIQPILDSFQFVS